MTLLRDFLLTLGIEISTHFQMICVYQLYQTHQHHKALETFFENEAHEIFEKQAHRKGMLLDDSQKLRTFEDQMVVLASSTHYMSISLQPKS